MAELARIRKFGDEVVFRVGEGRRHDAAVMSSEVGFGELAGAGVRRTSRARRGPRSRCAVHHVRWRSGRAIPAVGRAVDGDQRSVVPRS